MNQDTLQQVKTTYDQPSESGQIVGWIIAKTIKWIYWASSIGAGVYVGTHL